MLADSPDERAGGAIEPRSLLGYACADDASFPASATTHPWLLAHGTIRCRAAQIVKRREHDAIPFSVTLGVWSRRSALR